MSKKDNQMIYLVIKDHGGNCARLEQPSKDAAEKAAASFMRDRGIKSAVVEEVEVAA